MSMVSYAQNFEDVILQRVFSVRNSGFYIDVGAWHPEMHSVTKHFYDRGWRGINIEPIEAQIRLFDQQRPRDVNLHAGVGEKEGTLPFFECIENQELSSFDPENRQMLETRGFHFRSYQVPVLPLQKILEDHAIQEVDFLKIDVEGWEAQVLRSIDLRAFRPRVLVIESVLPAVQITDWSKQADVDAYHHWEPLVLSSGYVFAYYDGLSRFYLREENREQSACFRLPPGAHDDFQMANYVAARQTIDAIESDQKAKEALIQRLSHELAEVRSDQQAKEALIRQLSRKPKEAPIQRLSQELAEVRGDQQAKEALIRQLSQELAEVRGDQQAKEALIQRVSQELAEVRHRPLHHLWRYLGEKARRGIRASKPGRAKDA